MRLRVHVATANEELVVLINEGYEIFSDVQAMYNKRKAENTYNDSTDADELVSPLQVWADKVEESLIQIFPTKLEAYLFNDPVIPFHTGGGDSNYQEYIFRCRHFIRGLNKIRLDSLPEYTDLPLDFRLYVEDIESFRKVRDVNPAIVEDELKNGYFDKSEEFVQSALERILRVSFHKKDWGGEINDLYTANLSINGTRHETAFLLKWMVKILRESLKRMGRSSNGVEKTRFRC